MKKVAAVLVGALLFAPFISFASTDNSSLIAILLEEVKTLEAEITALQVNPNATFQGTIAATVSNIPKPTNSLVGTVQVIQTPITIPIQKANQPVIQEVIQPTTSYGPTAPVGVVVACSAMGYCPDVPKVGYMTIYPTAGCPLGYIGDECNTTK
jgi:hypothetical protein